MLIILTINPIILCGGSGVRLWPLSRQQFPKQFVSLVNGESLLDLTFKRLKLFGSHVTCLTNEDYRFLVLDCMNKQEIDGELILEPSLRNTAPAMALAGLNCDPENILLFCPADHYIPDAPAFKSTIEFGLEAAQKNMIVTFGIKPNFAATSYGYIEVDHLDSMQAMPVKQFIEKPSQEVAKKLIKSSQVLWNGGIFLVKASTLLDGLSKEAPDILNQAKISMRKKSEETFSYHGSNFKLIRPEASSFNHCPSESIDYALLERVKNISVVMFNNTWSDMGSWKSVAETLQADEKGNRVDGKVKLFNTSNSYIYAPYRPVVTLGVNDLSIIDTPDAILIADNSELEGIKDIVKLMSIEGMSEVTAHKKTFRPWGNFDEIDGDQNFKVKRIVVSPGSSISLQLHQKRSEHWVVVEGEATVTLKDKVFKLKKNQSTFIPMNEKHRLSNHTKSNLVIIEIQVGDYLGEDDIQRFEDFYMRNVDESALITSNKRNYYLHIKRWIDFFGALLALIIFSPIMLIVSFLIKFSSPGPIFYKQLRHGQYNQHFEIIKFRTMLVHEDNEFKQATINDPRFTWVGKFLRRTSIDELPQLFNVLKGEMSLVGPRPHAIEHNQYYEKKIDRYMERHQTKPGMTGWAQVNGYRGETKYISDMKLRVEHDLVYLERISFLFDLEILFKTFLIVVLPLKMAY